MIQKNFLKPPQGQKLMSFPAEDLAFEIHHDPKSINKEVQGDDTSWAMWNSTLQKFQSLRNIQT